MRFAALWIAAACLVVFALEMIFGVSPFVLDTNLLWSQPWRIPLSVLAHAGVQHLLFNLFSLVLFGLILEGVVGARRVLWLFVVSGILVALATPLTPYTRVLGASAAIFAIIGALVALRPRMVIWLDFVPMPMAVAGLVWIAIDVFGIFYPTDVANYSHLIGMAIGFAVGLYWRRFFGPGAPERPRGPRRRRDPMLDTRLDDYERQVGLR